MELDIPPSPPPVEATLAERRAKRQAILAKYTRAIFNFGHTVYTVQPLPKHPVGGNSRLYSVTAFSTG